MATIKHSVPASPTTVSITLNGVADGAWTLSSAISNDAAGELAMFADFEFYMNGSGLRGSGPYLDFYMLTELDGTNYTTGDASNIPSDKMLFFRVILIPNSTLGIRAHKRGVLLPPTDFKILFHNKMTVSTSSSPSPVLTFSQYSLQVS